MIANDLTPEIWNAISNLVGRSSTPRQIWFCKVAKVDAIRNLIWTEEFGQMAIPLAGFELEVTYYDTHGNPDEYVDRKTAKIKVVAPKKGSLVLILDPEGAKRFPVCLGVIQSKTGFWEGG